MKLKFTTAGESHGPGLIAVLEGIPAGLSITTREIDQELSRRQKGYGSGPRMKVEHDRAKIISGVMEGVTIGAPIAILIENVDFQKWAGVEVAPFTIPRPGHADLTGVVKYGFDDLRFSLERASARETAARVAVGAVCKQLLRLFDIKIGGYVKSVGNVIASVDAISLTERLELAEQNEVRCPDSQAVERIREEIRSTIQSRDTLGGVIEIIALGVPAGLGSYNQWDSRLEARLGYAILSVQAIKGVEIGAAFENAHLRGTGSHDQILVEGGKLVRATNRAGGIEGGISNGEPIVIRAAMKPIATTLSPQRSVDLATGEEVTTKYERSDFCPVPRAVPILEAMVAFIIANELLEKLGGDSINEIRPRFAQLRSLELTQLHMESRNHIYWPSPEDESPSQATL